jgi:hypothetical protein
MRLFADANPVRVMASGAIDVNHKDEMYDGKVRMPHCMIQIFHWMDTLHTCGSVRFAHAISNKNVLFIFLLKDMHSEVTIKA